MKDALLLKTLRSIGLNDKESELYLAALRLGPTTALALARASALKRTTVYSVLDSLIAKGLMRKEVMGVKDYFVAAHPDDLRSLLEKQQEDFLSALPHLAALHRVQGAQNVVRYYEGVAGARLAYTDLLKSVRLGEDYLVLSTMEQWYNLDPEFFMRFLEKRGKLDIKVRMILTESKLAASRKGPLRKPNERTRILPKGTQLTTNLIIIPSKVVIHQLTPPIMVMVIENEHIVRLHREMYELIWQGLRD